MRVNEKMVMDNEFLLMDRLQKIQQVIGKYGEENFYLSFSGGKDSIVLSALVDMAIPGNKIPRVYANTGIEYCMILEFVEREKEKEHPWKLIILNHLYLLSQCLKKRDIHLRVKNTLFMSVSIKEWVKNRLIIVDTYFQMRKEKDMVVLKYCVINLHQNLI